MMSPLNSFLFFEEAEYIKDKSIDFCRKQVLKGAMIKSAKLLKSSSFEEIEKLIKDGMEPTQSPRSINGEYITNCSYLSVSGNPFCVQADHRPQVASTNEEERGRAQEQEDGGDDEQINRATRQQQPQKHKNIVCSCLV